MNNLNLAGFTDVLGDEIGNSQESQPMSLSSEDSQFFPRLDNNIVNIPEPLDVTRNKETHVSHARPAKGTGQYGQFRSLHEIDVKYRSVFSYPFFNLVQSSVIEYALYSDKPMVVCAPTGSGKTVVFEMAIVQLLMEIEDKQNTEDFKIIYMAPVKALCTERLMEWYPKFTRLGLLCIEVTGDTDVDFSQLKPYRIIITTPEKWDMVTRRWREHRRLVEVIKLFLIDEVHILNDEARGPVLEAVVSRMKTIESSAQSAHRIEQLQKQYQGTEITSKESPPKIRFVAVSATVSNPQDVAAWLGTADKPAVYYKFGDESRPVKLKRIVEGYPCPEGTSIFKFDIILNYKLWPVIQKYHNGKPTLIFCNTRKSVALTAETLSKELTVTFNPEQKAKLTALASKIKNKKLQALVLSGVACHHAGLLFEERTYIEQAFRNRDLPILITTTTLAMGVNLPAHLVIVKNTQQYVNGAYQEYSISTILQMVGRAGRPQFDTEATAVIMTRLCDKPRYQSLVEGSEPLQSYLHKRLAENLNSEAALGTVNDVAQCVQWLRSTFLCVRAVRDPKRYLGLPQAAPQQLILKKIEDLCVKAMNGLATAGLITMDEASCIESTAAGRLMSIFYLDLETMKHIMKINGTETLERVLWVICESHELADMHLRVDERRCLNALNRNTAAATIRFPMKGKISSRQMKLNCIIQAVLGCLNIPDPSLNQEAMKIMRIADRICKCLVAYVTRPALITQQPKYHSAVLNAITLAKCVTAHLWENSPFVSKQLKGIGPTFSTLLATAGKANFMLLEESHPRDLERIMNKGPPAGNVLRKQISLLPKYQISMTPINEKSVTVQLVLLNQNYLSENMERLTAGDTHKSYVIVGDSENNLLLLTSFKDKDLISVYDGTITHQITRKHSFEHKMYAYCVSSSFVGIDAQSEYLFKNLDSPHSPTNTDFIRKTTNKQMAITDTFKERKRKNTSEDISQSKEKKKRDNVLFEKFKCLKESFGKTSKELKDDLDKSTVMSNRILQELTQLEKPTKSTEVLPVAINDHSKIRIESTKENRFDKNSSIQEISTEVIDDFIDDEKLNSIFESEISKRNHDLDLHQVDLGATKNTKNIHSLFFTEPCSSNVPQRNNHLRTESKTLNNKNKRAHKNIKSNYNFIDLLEKNIDFSDEEEIPEPEKDSGFSDTIKCQIEKYLQHTKNISKVPDISLSELLHSDGNKKTVRNENEYTSDQRFQITNISNIEAIESGKHNETIHEFQNNLHVDFINTRQKEADENNPTNKRADYTIERENYDTDQTVTEVINDDNNIAIVPPNATIKIYPNCGSQVNPKYNTERLCNKENMSPSKNINTYDNDTQKENNFKSSDLILLNDANGLAPIKKQDVDTQLKPSYQSINETIPDTITKECTSKSIIALPFPHFVPAYSKKSEAQRRIVCKANTINSRSDLKIKSNYSSLTPTINSTSKQFAPTSENRYNSHANASNPHINVKKYSYSTTQINVTTRNAHLVQVTRKIKMDLNITEIISQENKVNHRLQDIDQNPKDFEFPVPPKEFQDKEIKNDIIAYNRGSINDDNMINTDIQDTFTDKNNDHLETPKFTPPLPQFNLQCKQIEQSDSDANVNNDKENNIVKERVNKINIIPQEEGGSNRIENILQKYSKILKKNNTANLNQSLTQPKDMDKGLCNTPSEKPKRPFNITDILNPNIPLPKTLISETCKRENVVHTYNEIAKQENIPEVQNVIEQNFTNQGVDPSDNNFQDPLEPEETLKDFNLKLSVFQKDLLDNLEEVPNYNLPDIEIEELDPQRTEVDYDIDQSMFNPKTLLQCLSKDDPDIIPPPPEFCDESELIIHKVDDLTVPMDCYEPMRWNNFCDNYDQTKEKILQDISHIELTPTKEIETWTLSQEEIYENPEASTSFNPTQSSTTMQNSGQRRSQFNNIAVSSQTMLGQFKYCRKKKYRPKI